MLRLTAPVLSWLKSLCQSSSCAADTHVQHWSSITSPTGVFCHGSSINSQSRVWDRMWGPHCICMHRMCHVLAGGLHMHMHVLLVTLYKVPGSCTRLPCSHVCLDRASAASWGIQVCVACQWLYGRLLLSYDCRFGWECFMQDEVVIVSDCRIATAGAVARNSCGLYQSIDIAIGCGSSGAV